MSYSLALSDVGVWKRLEADTLDTTRDQPLDLWRWYASSLPGPDFAKGSWQLAGVFTTVKELCEHVRTFSRAVPTWSPVQIYYSVYAEWDQRWVVEAVSVRNLIEGDWNLGIAPGSCCAHRTGYVDPKNAVIARSCVDKWYNDCKGGVTYDKRAYPRECSCHPEHHCPMPSEAFVPDLTEEEFWAKMAAVLSEGQPLPPPPPPPTGRPTPTRELLAQMAERARLRTSPSPGSDAPDTSGWGDGHGVALGLAAVAVSALGLLWWAGRSA